MIARLRGSQSVRHGAAVFTGVAVASVLSYLFYVIISRRAGVETLGVVASLVSALLVVATPANIGQLIAARLAADLQARGDRAALRRLADVMTTWSAALAALVVVAGVLASGPLAAFFHLTDRTPVVVAVIAMGVYAVIVVQRGVLQGSHLFGAFSLSMVIEATGKLLVGVTLVVVFGATGGVLGVLAGSTLALLYHLYAFPAALGTRRAPIALDRSVILRVSSHVGLGQLTFTVLTFYDVPLIAHAFDPHTAGLYAAAALVGRAIISAISFVPTLVMPKATARVAAGQAPLPLLALALGIALGIVLVVAAASALAPALVVTVIAGRAFRAAAPLVLLYALASGSLALANVVGAYKMGLHRYDFVVPAIVVAATEIAVIAAWHPSLHAVVSVLAIGHFGVLLATLYRVTAHAGTQISPQAVVVSEL